jgi:hypothetical protein
LIIREKGWKFNFNQVFELNIDKNRLDFFTLAYLAFFLARGSLYAVNSPWYFVPVLPVAYLSSATGIVWLLEMLSKDSLIVQKACNKGIIQSFLIFAWFVPAFIPMSKNAANLQTQFIDERERVYANAAVWVGKHLNKGPIIAVNEIDAAAFFLPPDFKIVDLFGLLRDRDVLYEPYISLVEKVKPHCIFTRDHFSCKSTI